MKFKSLKIKTSTRICLTAIVLWVAAMWVGKLLDGYLFGEFSELIVVGVIAFTLLKFILEGVIDKEPDSKSE